MKSVLLITNEKKLGDAIITFSAVKRAQKGKERSFVLVRMGFLNLARQYRIRNVIPFVGHIDLIFISLLLRFVLSVDDLVYVSGVNSTAFQIGRIYRGANFIYRDRDSVYKNGFVVERFGHYSNLEYSLIVLSASFSQLNKYRRLEKFGDDQLINRKGKIAIFPISAEKRKNITPASVKVLYEYYKNKSKEVVLGLPSVSSHEFSLEGYISHVLEESLLYYGSLRELESIISSASLVISADTGTFVYSVARRKKTIVIIGPTQPEKISVCSDEAIEKKLRMKALGNHHCDNKECDYAYCIDQCVAENFSSEPLETKKIPDFCLMRKVVK